MITAFTLIKSLHIVAVIAWMAGLLYLYRLYVYHRAETEAVVMARFRMMERRLWYAIAVPAAWVAALSGAAMALMLPCRFLPEGWFTLKLLLVAGLIAAHLAAGRHRLRFQAPPFPATERAFRFLNEVPTLLMIGIVLLVEFQPPWWRWPFC